MLNPSRLVSDAELIQTLVHCTVLQIDRLSILPPELLSDIFDLAHDPNHPLLDGLSRTLYPYVRRNLYRRIRSETPSSFRSLVATLQRDGSLVSIILEFDASGAGNGKEPLQEFLSLRGPSATASDLDDSLLVRLPFLASLSYSCDFISPNDFLRLSELESLTQLKIRFVVFESVVGFESTESEPAPLKELHLVGQCEVEDRWSPELARIVDSYSSLTRLVLDDSAFPDFRRFLSTLTLVKSTISSLSLLSVPLYTNYNIACDHILPQFQNLEHLEVGDGAITEDLPLYLRRLRNLSSLRFGLNALLFGPSFYGIIELVRGPNRISTLKTLVIDSFEGQIGERFDVGDYEELVEGTEVPISATGWTCEGLRSDWSTARVLELVEAARENGVCVGGSFLGVTKVWDAGDLELANRLILRAYKEKSLEEYVWAKSRHSRSRLPNLDVEKLDPEHLELVKIELPEESWFQLTLE